MKSQQKPFKNLTDGEHIHPKMYQCYFKTSLKTQDLYYLNRSIDVFLLKINQIMHKYSIFMPMQMIFNLGDCQGQLCGQHWTV